MNYSFYVIAIGFSAGGLLPLSDIVSKIPVGANGAFVIVSHLLANADSSLDLILSKNSDLPVVWVSQGLKAEAQTIYLLPPNMIMSIKKGSFSLRARRPAEIVNSAIDIFFTSLAIDAASKAIGVILSGGGDDGLSGAKAIHINKGYVITQDPKTARFPFMPKAVISGDHPDDVLSPTGIIQKITAHIGVN